MPFPANLSLRQRGRLQGSRRWLLSLAWGIGSQDLVLKRMVNDMGQPFRQWGQCYFALYVFLVSVALLSDNAIGAEQTRPVRIGALTESWGPQPSLVSLRDGLLELGYRENEQFVIGVRFTQGNAATLPQAARELVQQGVDIIYASQATSVKAAQLATSEIPIVFAGVGDPVGLGLVESLSRPGGNVTGVTDLDLELLPKRLEIFRELIPGLKRVLFPYDASDTYSQAEARIYREAAHHLGIKLVEKAVRTKEEAQATLAQVLKKEVHGILSPRHAFLNIPGLILETASRREIPTMFHTAFYAERGGIASYGPGLYESGRQAARLVDKILKGTPPTEIPVEVNNKIEFTINLKVAKRQGLTIPLDVLYRANRVIR